MDIKPSSLLSFLPPSSPDCHAHSSPILLSPPLISSNPPPVLPFLQHQQDLSNEEKTDVIFQCLQNLRLSLPAFFKLAMSKSQYKAQMVQAFAEDTKLVTSVMPRSKQHLNHVEWGVQKYQQELLALTESKYFGRWMVAEIKNQAMNQTATTDVMQQLQRHAPHLLHLFSFITQPVRHTKSRHKSLEDRSTRWVSIFAILCYTFAPRKSNMWAVMCGIQLHAQETKKHIIQSMNHIGFVIGYNQILKVMKSISDVQKSELQDIRKNHQAFVAVYDNFEQILGVQDQKSDHNKKFFSMTTCQFFTPMWMPEQGFQQSMFNQAHLLN